MAVKRELTVREEVELWQRRDVTIDFVCAVVLMVGLGFIVGIAL